MKFGLSVCPEVGRARDTLEQARVAERLGYDSVWLPEHHLMPGYVPSPMLGLAAIGAVTQRVTLGTDVAIVPFYHPVRLAEEAAMLSDMTGGRFVLGTGLGYRRSEFDALDAPFDRRGARLSEALAVVRRLLDEENVSVAGDFYRLQDVTVYPRPPSRIPLLVGGWSTSALTRAARLGDAWFPGPTAHRDRLRKCLATYDEALAQLGRHRLDLPIFREVWVAEDPASRREGVDQLTKMYVDDYLTWGHRNVAPAGGGDPWEELRRDRFLVGSPDEVVDEVRRYRDDFGVTHLVARMHFHGSDQAAVIRSMELFAGKVIPQLRETAVTS